MVRIQLAEQFSMAAGDMFELFVTREGREQMMADYIRKVEVVGEGTGSIYRMYATGLLPEGCIVERTELFDPDNFSVDYYMLDTGGVVPFADYRAGIRVQRAGTGACVLTLFSSFVPIALSDQAGEEAATRNYRSLFARLRQMCT